MSIAKNDTLTTTEKAALPALFNGQNRTVFLRLLGNFDRWVECRDFPQLDGVMQYNARLYSIRRKLAELGGDFEIVNRVEPQPDGTKHGSFRLQRTRQHLQPISAGADPFLSIEAATRQSATPLFTEGVQRA